MNDHIVELHRITRLGALRKCYVRATDIKSVEISNRDGHTTVVRTTTGLLAVKETVKQVLADWTREDA